MIKSIFLSARGLQQGDPISPMLFAIVREVLNSLICEADRRGALSPLLDRAISHCASLCVDNIVILVANCVQQILRLFGGASGLVTNIDKFVTTPICCMEEMIVVVQEVFPCIVAPFPCRYLGILLSLKKLRWCDEQALVDSVATRILTWKSDLLTHVGRVLLTKVTLSAILVHISIACCLSS
jgi:hypothetical protein